MSTVLKTLAPLVALTGLVLASPSADAGAKSAERALDELSNGRKPYNAVQNRFFLKEGRFELAPIAGYVPNNPFVKRYVGGALFAYHFSETFAAEGAIMYAPDLGDADMKDLTSVLVCIGNQECSEDTGFQQPLDKMTLGATFAARWAPIYGKINLIGETVLNFDFYATAGLGMLSMTEYYARFDKGAATETNPGVVVETVQAKVKVPVQVGVGMNNFISQTVAIKIDARSYLYADKKPSYQEGVKEEEGRLYNIFVASVGVSMFFPKMKPRLYDF